MPAFITVNVSQRKTLKEMSNNVYTSDSVVFWAHGEKCRSSGQVENIMETKV